MIGYEAGFCILYSGHFLSRGVVTHTSDFLYYVIEFFLWVASSIAIVVIAIDSQEDMYLMN